MCVPVAGISRSRCWHFRRPADSLPHAGDTLCVEDNSGDLWILRVHGPLTLPSDVPGAQDRQPLRAVEICPKHPPGSSIKTIHNPFGPQNSSSGPTILSLLDLGVSNSSTEAAELCRFVRTAFCFTSPTLEVMTAEHQDAPESIVHVLRNDAHAAVLNQEGEASA